MIGKINQYSKALFPSRYQCLWIGRIEDRNVDVALDVYLVVVSGYRDGKSRAQAVAVALATVTEVKQQ